jgi:predicted XRE-type DNA-binding protein
MLDQTTLIFSVSDLVRGKWEKFSPDMLITLAARVGQKPRLALKAA